MDLFTIALVLATIYLLQFLPSFFNFLRLVKFSQKVKGPGFLEFVQNARKGKILYWFKSLRKKYGSRFCIWFGKDLTLFLTDPDDVRIVLGSNQLLYKSKNYRFVEVWLGKGLLTNGGESWHERRKMLTPAFHFKMLSEFKQPMEEHCDIFLKKLEEKANGEAFDIYPYITLLALDIICLTAMGIKKNALLESKSDYVTAVQDICHIVHKQSFSLLRRYEFLFGFTEASKRRAEALSILHGETNRVMELRRKLLKESQILNLEDAAKADEVGVKRRLAFLDILLLAQMNGADLSDVAIREEVDTFLFEGHDTTSSAMSFAIYQLSQNPEVQQKAYEEAVALKGMEKETMKYIEAVIKETLRLYPSVPFYSRYMAEDFEIGDLKVPKGVSVSVAAYVVHRDEKYHPDPEKFIPERFLDNERTTNPYSFVAFSAGPRNCIGQKFAMLELKCTLAKLLRTYHILPVEGFVPLPLAELVTKSGNGIQIKLKKRQEA